MFDTTFIGKKLHCPWSKTNVSPFSKFGIPVLIHTYRYIRSTQKTWCFETIVISKFIILLSSLWQKCRNIKGTLNSSVPPLLVTCHLSTVSICLLRIFQDVPSTLKLNCCPKLSRLSSKWSLVLGSKVLLELKWPLKYLTRDILLITSIF